MNGSDENLLGRLGALACLAALAALLARICGYGGAISSVALPQAQAVAAEKPAAK